MNHNEIAALAANTLLEEDLIQADKFKEVKQVIEDKIALHLLAESPSGVTSLEADVWNTQFVSAEALNNVDKDDNNVSEYHLEHKPYCAGTLTGTVEAINKGELRTVIQTFIADNEGIIAFKNIGNPKGYVNGGVVKVSNSVIYLGWTGTMPEHKLVVNYDYKVE